MHDERPHQLGLSAIAVPASIPAWKGHAVAVATVLVAYALREALTPAIGPTSLPFITFLPAVTWAAWYGGLGPGLLATVLSGLAANWFFFTPIGTFRLDVPITFFAFPVSAALILAPIEMLHRARRKVVRAYGTMSTTLSSIGDGVVVTDSAGRVTFLNPEAERLTGWQRGDAEGRPLSQVFRVVNEHTRREVENPVEQVLRDGKVVGLANHTLLIARTGEETPIDDSAAPIGGPGEAEHGVVLVFRDVTEQRLAETERARLAAIVSSSGDAILAKNMEGRIVSWNAAAERLFGYSAAQIIGRSVEVLIPEEHRFEEASILDRLRKGQPTELIETTRLTRDGRRMPVSVRVSPLRDSEGVIFGASSIIRDLSEVVAARNALAEEKELLATTLSSIGDAVIATDAKAAITFLNPVAEKLTGWSLAEAVGMPLVDVFRIVNETTRSEVDNPAIRAMREGVIVGLANHTVLMSRTGAECAIDDSGAPIRDRDGNIVGAVLVFRDVTQRRLAERNLEDARERSRSVIDHVVDGIIAIDETGLIESFNRAAERVFGYDASEVIGCNVRVLMPEPYQREHDDYLRNYTTTGQAKVIGIGREVLGRRKDGTTFPMDLAVSEFHAGGRRYFTGIVRDITERKRHEAAMLESEQALRLADQRKNEFIATLAHELRNPLGPISNSIALLQLKGPPEKELVDARRIIERQVQHLSRLLDDLLDVNRLGRRDLEIRRERVTLDAVIASALETARPTIEARRHDLLVEMPKDVILDADPLRLSQVFANVLNNAAKYMDPGGQIRVAAALDGASVTVVISDEGMGIAPEYLPKLFELYAQVPLALERSQGGVGIGLWLARKLVELHGGSISAHSEGIGRGSEFRVRLPVTVGAAVSDGQDVQRPAQKTVSRRILVADDVRDNADTLAMLLGALGHEAHVAYDGVEAVAAAERIRPEVALLDIGMAGMDGYEVCRSLRASPWGKSMYLIAQTGWGQDEDRRRAQEAGFDRHMLKPIDTAALVVVLANLPERMPLQ